VSRALILIRIEGIEMKFKYIFLETKQEISRENAKKYCWNESNLNRMEKIAEQIPAGRVQNYFIMVERLENEIEI
jgi:hypothetical protein